MSEHDVPAERDELRERLATTLAALVALRDAVRDSGRLNGMEYDELGVEVNRAIEKAEAALLAPQEAPAAGDIDSLDAAMKALHDQLYAEGREGDALIVERAAYAIEALEVDRVLRAAPQEARGPDIEALAEAVHDAYLATCARLGWDVKPENRVPYAELSEDSKELDRASVRAVLAGLAAARPAPEDRETAERKAVKAREFFAARGDEDDEFDSIDVLPVYLGAPAKAVTCPCGGGPGHGDVWCGDYECPTCGRGPKQEEAIFQAGMERGRAGAEAVVREALRDCEEVLRLIHEAAGPVPKDAPMPRTTSWGAWKAAREALGLPTAPGAPEEGAGES